jgi:hypothetical protein
MIGRAVRHAIFLSMAIGMLAACGSSDRPSELSLDDVKACELVGRQDLVGLDVQAKPTPGSNLTAGEEGSGCLYIPRTGGRIDVDAITNYGADRWMDSAPEHARAEEAPRVRGFRAVKVWRAHDDTGPHGNCTLYVDAAGGQSLKVQVAENDEKDPPTCDTARRFADAAMKTLTK